MKTKTIEARHLQAGDEIVDGGDGARRTSHPIGELRTSSMGVLAVVRKGDAFDRRTFNPKDPVRIKESE